MKARALFTCLCLAAMLLAEGTANAITDQFIFTENSPTSLTATLDGFPLGSVTNVGNDHWLAGGPSPNTGIGLAVNWLEPENNGLVNSVVVTSEGSYDIFSDSSPIAGSPTFANGVPAPLGTDENDVPILVTFNDKAATAEVTPVPEPGTAPMVLLGIALIGMEGLRRRFRTA